MSLNFWLKWQCLSVEDTFCFNWFSSDSSLFSLRCFIWISKFAFIYCYLLNCYHIFVTTLAVSFINSLLFNTLLFFVPIFWLFLYLFYFCCFYIWSNFSLNFIGSLLSTHYYKCIWDHLNRQLFLLCFLDENKNNQSIKPFTFSLRE